MAKQFQLKDPHRESRINSARTHRHPSSLSVCWASWSAGTIHRRSPITKSIAPSPSATGCNCSRCLPKRGLIYDRNGCCWRIIAQLHVVIVREQVADLDATLAELAELLPISAGDLENFHKKLRRRRPYEAVPLRFRLTPEERARLAVTATACPGGGGCPVAALLPHGELFSHAMGCVGRINEQETTGAGRVRLPRHLPCRQGGVEKFYEDILHGAVGYQNVETNAHGRVLRVLEQPRPGSRDPTLC